ncbi:HAD family hydrolase [Candidatus Aerophobetes bacterium]|nr:HAD family hydrolase [Candidatus Aerophobetes bacterium]
MKKIYISFDVDGTLIKPDYNELIWFKEIPELYATKYSVDIEKAAKLVREEYEKVGEDDIRWYILQYWLDRFGFKIKEEEILRKYEDEVEIYEEALFVLDELYGRFSLVASSAMPRSFIDVKLKKNNLFRYFEKIFSAVSDFKMVKKEDAFYRRICKELGISTRSLVHIGDNFEADYLAAQKAGVKAFYLDRTNSHSTKQPHVVSSLLEFTHRLRNPE